MRSPWPRWWPAALLAFGMVLGGCGPWITMIPTYWTPDLHNRVGMADERTSSRGPIDPDAYNVAEGRFGDIAKATGGRAYKSHGVHDLPKVLRKAMTNGLDKGAPVDLALVIDTTGSMGDDIRAVRKRLRWLVDNLEESNPNWRIGLVEYRDTGDDFDARVVQRMTNNSDKLRSGIAKLRADGGGDFCEHVYAGLASALRDLRWREIKERRIILIGDSPPHDDYEYDERRYDNVIRVARAKHIQVHAVGAYCDKSCQASVEYGCGSE